MTRLVSDNATLQLLDLLEGNAHHYAHDWLSFYQEDDGQYGLLFTDDVNGFGATLKTLDPHLRDALKHLLNNAHTLIALARLGAERVHGAEQTPRLEWPPARCRACGSGQVHVHRKMRPDARRAAYGVACRACGYETTELGPPPALPLEAHPAG